MRKTAMARYTPEFKQAAVRLIDGGQITAGAARALRIVEQRLFNWVKAQRQGRLRAVDRKPWNAEQREIRRLRVELAREKITRDILGKATARAMQEG